MEYVFLALEPVFAGLTGGGDGAEVVAQVLANPAALYFGLQRAAFHHAAEERPEWKKYLFLEDAYLERTA